MSIRAVAQGNGEKFYTTGRPCVNGHAVKRRVSTGHCIECERENNRRVSKESRAAYYKKNKRKMRAANKKSKVKHHEKRLQELKQWREHNKNAIKKYNVYWCRANRGKSNAKTARRRAALLMATPSWLTSAQQKEMQDVYVEAARTRLEVDHVIPLKNERVCGLHVPWNLQLLSKSENCSKGNSYVG